MKLFLECIPCVLKQALEASQKVTDDERIHAEVMEEALKIAADYKSYRNAPEMARDIHQVLKKKTGNPDPYKAVKDEHLETAKGLYSYLKDFLDGKEDRLLWALKIAATGNNLDAAIYSDIQLEKQIEVEVAKPFAINDYDTLKSKLASAKKALILGDNTGETVFDKILLEELEKLPLDEIHYAVKEEPIINDATILEAEASDIHHHAKIISTGCNVPGLLLDEASDAFLKVFREADIVISKGQGNFETLSDQEGIFFLLKVKCPMVSKMIGSPVGEYVLKCQKV